MNDDPQKAVDILRQAEEAAQVATNAAAVAKDAVAQAAEANMNKKNADALADALRQVFGEGVQAQRFVDVTRVPLICKSIIDIHANLKEIKDMLDKKYVTTEAFWPVKTIVYLGATTTLLGVIGALLALIIKK